MARKKGLVRLCGLRSIRGIAHGCGSGLSIGAAVAAAEGAARLVAQAAGQTWIAAQRCGAICPFKHGWVEAGGTATKRGGRRARTLSINKTSGGASPGQIPPLVTYTVCIAILWRAFVTCNTRIEDVA